MPYISVSPSPRPPPTATFRPPPAASSPSNPPSPSDYLSLLRTALLSFSRRPNPPPSRSPRSSLVSYSRSAAATRRLLRHLFHPSIASYNALINSLFHANHTVAASAVFSSLLLSGLPLTTPSINIFLKLILSTSRATRFDAAYTFIHKMLQHGPTPDALTFSTFIGALSRAGRIRDAVVVLDLMLHNNCCPTPQTCTSLIHGYCSQGKIKEARDLVALIESYGFPPDTFMYTVLIDALSRIGEFDEVESILGESEEKGWKPDEVTYNVYMSGLCKARRISEAFGLLDAMRVSGLFPSLETLNILFDCLCRDSKLHDAIQLLSTSSELDWFPDVVFYNTLLSRCLDSSYSANVLLLFSNMVKRGIEPDACTLTLLIRSMFTAGKLHLARCMINGSWGFVPDIIAFNTLFHQLYILGENKEVIKLFADMIQKKNVTPNKFTYYIVIDSLYKEGMNEEAIELILGTIEEDFVHELISRLIRWLAGGKKLGAILKLFKKLGESSIIDARSVNSLIFYCCKTGLCRSQDFYRLSIIIDEVFGIM